MTATDPLGEAQALARLARGRVRHLVAQIRELNRIVARLDDTVAELSQEDTEHDQRDPTG